MYFFEKDQRMNREDQNVEESFLLYDRCGDNKIDCSQIGEVLRALGINPTEYEIKKIIKEIDSTGEKRVSFGEFYPMFQSLRDRHKKERRGKMFDVIVRKRGEILN